MIDSAGLESANRARCDCHPPYARRSLKYRNIIRKMTCIPLIEKRCICIADRGAVVLGAVISSYLFEPETYLPLFTFPAITVAKANGDHVSSEVYLSNLMGSE